MDKDKETQQRERYIELLGSIPVLQYLKRPVEDFDELYRRYPNGGELGWFLFVHEIQAYVYWNTEQEAWVKWDAGGLKINVVSELPEAGNPGEFYATFEQ